MMLRPGTDARRRGLSSGDRAAWASYARLVAPLPGVVAPVAEPVVAEAVSAVPGAASVHVPVASVRAGVRPTPVVVGGVPAGVDKASWARFRTGKLPATRTLDLHGRTAQRAHAVLGPFIQSAVADGVRCVEVITGRGSGESGGVIRREFPLWLNQPHLRPLILAAAHPHALNPGSVRLLLRRAR